MNAANVENAMTELQGCSFQGRNLGRSLEILSSMVADTDCLRVLTLSGALIPAGMDEIICQSIERGIFHAIVSTGANITHSVVNACDSEQQAHYIGTCHVDDKELYHHRINRIYDTFLPETSYHSAEKMLEKMVLDTCHEPMTILRPSELFAWIGSQLPSSARSFVRVAYDHDVPIFCGATSDSEIGLDILAFRLRHNISIILDEIGDVARFGEYIQGRERAGLVILGGGVPRNWAQQVYPYLDQMYHKTYAGYSYSIRFHTAVVEDGGLSGCTIHESVSWGKYHGDVAHQSVWGDATVYFPLIMTALFQRSE